jgi:gluconate 5-dehydrogenase
MPMELQSGMEDRARIGHDVECGSHDDAEAAVSVRVQLFDLTGRRALVTGSSQGIGQALSRGLAEAGAALVLNGRDRSKLSAAAQGLRESGHDVAELAFDVTDHEGVRAAVDGFEEEIGPIDILVNNAGIQHRAPLEDFPADAFERLLQTNVASVFNVGQACARHMIARGAGKIINIASVQSALARPGIAPYTATKGAVANLTKGMAADWARHGLQCNAIAPGYFDTPLNAALVSDPDFSTWLANRTPAGRWGRVEELVGAAIFLASDASSFVNGHTLFVDGGITASL